MRCLTGIATDRNCQSGSRRWTTLTALLLLLHTRAGTVMAAAADVVGAVWGHRGQQGVARGNRRQDVVPYQFLHFTGPGASVGAGVAGVCRNAVEGDGAVVEVQRGRRGHVRGGAVLVEI